MTGPVNESETASAPATDAGVSGVSRLSLYLSSIGMNNPESIRTLAQWVRDRTVQQHADTQDYGPATPGVGQLIRCFDDWLNTLPGHIGMSGEAGRAAIASRCNLGGLLDEHASAIAAGDGLTLPEAMADQMRECAGQWPRGVLPICAPLEMHRQPLGELPAVLRGEFWQGTYKWVLPGDKAVSGELAEETAR